jgi:hypothetical protein
MAPDSYGPAYAGHFSLLFPPEPALPLAVPYLAVRKVDHRQFSESINAENADGIGGKGERLSAGKTWACAGPQNSVPRPLTALS